MSSFAEKIKKYSDEAPEAGFVNSNYGELSARAVVVKWEEINGERKATRKPYTEDYELQEGEYLEAVFGIDIQALNPQLTFQYERTVRIQNNGTQPADWESTVLPSLEAVFGDKWPQLFDVKKPLKAFVKAEDVPNVLGKTSKTSGKVYTVPKFVAKFKNLDECKAARDKQYGGNPTAGPWDETGNGTVAIPAEVLTQVASLIKSVGRPTAKQMLLPKPFGDYEADALLAAVPE